ncbi:MAG: ribonuclease III [Clostridia bacterium]|nr:ribonuclease III [Clostridia bacterium]
MNSDYEAFEGKLGYKFKNKELLKLAFTHTTYVFEHQQQHYQSNQRLEFIGDAILDLVIGRELYELKPYEGEGYLSKVRSIIVCEKSFAKVARQLGVGEYMLLGKGEMAQGGADTESTLADAFESIIAAVYFDSDFITVRQVALNNLREIIDLAVEGKIFLDYKSKLLEIAQTKDHQHEVKFSIINESGPSHMRVFEAQVTADGRVLATASGKSKRDAEQKCAELAIEEYNKIFVD